MTARDRRACRRRSLAEGAKWGVVMLLTFALHYAWEMLHAPWFQELAGLASADHFLPCLRAAAGDVVIATGAWLATAVLSGCWQWPFADRWIWPAVGWIALCEAATVVFELWALSVGRWTYTETMPVLGGIGVSPLLQWLVVPSLTLAVCRWMARDSVG